MQRPKQYEEVSGKGDCSEPRAILVGTAANSDSAVRYKLELYACSVFLSNPLNKSLTSKGLQNCYMKFFFQQCSNLSGAGR